VKRRPKVQPSTSTLDALLGEASWLLSHAEAFAEYGRQEEAQAEWARAAQCEEQVACVLDTAGRLQEASSELGRLCCSSPRSFLGTYAL
jgi:hypothetical protein